MSKKANVTVRNPYAAVVKTMGKRVVKSKKGKGSYSRKGNKQW